MLSSLGRNPLIVEKIYILKQLKVISRETHTAVFMNGIHYLGLLYKAISAFFLTNYLLNDDNGGGDDD